MNKPPQPPIKHAYWVIPSLFLAGEHPGSTNTQYAQESISALVKANITHFINLTEPHEWISYEPLLQQYAVAGGKLLHYHHLSIPDKQIPSIEQMKHILNIIDSALQQQEAVYVNCLAGIGRTGTVVGCYLARHGKSGQAALTRLAHLRRHSPDADLISPETDEQWRFVLAWKVGL